MSFWDNVKKFTQPYDDEYDDYDDEEMEGYQEEAEEPAPRASRRASSYRSYAEEDNSLDMDFGGVATTSAPSSAPTSSGFSGQVLNMNSNKQEVVLFRAKSFNDATKAADDLKNRKAVILNMENVDKALTRRVVDFLTGCIYALEGDVKKIANASYLFCPHGMNIVGDLENLQSEVESYI
ncbi:MAG TPA: cell division protein SepF [Candidatus Faecousia intestinigallinarum]|nr:cell division protein SepF [Candidatus Faecousia intestinigallinarum]